MMAYPEDMRPHVGDVVRTNGEEREVVSVGKSYVNFEQRPGEDKWEQRTAQEEDVELVARPGLPACERYASGEVPEPHDKIRSVTNSKDVMARVIFVQKNGYMHVNYRRSGMMMVRKANRYVLLQRTAN